MLVAGGGTGGHVYPLLAVVEAQKKESSDVDILYVGRPGGMEESIVARTDLPYRPVDAGRIRGMAPWTLLRNVGRLWRGYLQARAVVTEWHPDAVLVTGGYVSVPISMAAWRSRVPVMVYLPDREPGWAVRFLSWFVDRIAVSFDEVCSALPPACRQKVWVSGYPVRAALLNTNRSAGYQLLGLDPALKTLLVLGGSQGARPINQALVRVLPELLAHHQIVHVSGHLDWPWVSEKRDELPREVQDRYRVYPYLHEELSAAMAVADLVVARAGAATTAEFPIVGLPSILIPYPYAGQHQEWNADFMVSHGAAVRIDQIDLDRRLKSCVMRLLGDGAALEQMSRSTRALSKPDAAIRLAAELHRLARAREGKVQ